MKQINVWFEDAEHEEIAKIKDDHMGNWHDFIIDVVRHYKSTKLKKEAVGSRQRP